MKKRCRRFAESGKPGALPNSAELKAQFLAAVEEGQDATVAFMKEQGCDITKEELVDALSKLTEDRELTPAEIESISGGSKSGWNDFFSSWAEDDERDYV